MYDCQILFVSGLQSVRKLILLEYEGNIYHTLCRLVFNQIILLYISLFIYFRCKESYIIQKSVFFCKGLPAAIWSVTVCHDPVRIGVQCIHISIIVIIAAGRSDRCNHKLRILRNCSCMLQCRCYQYLIIFIGKYGFLSVCIFQKNCGILFDPGPAFPICGEGVYIFLFSIFCSDFFSFKSCQDLLIHGRFHILILDNLK